MSILKTLYEKDLYPEIDDTIDEAGAFQRDLIEIAAERHAKGEIDRRAFLTALAGIGALGMAGLPTGADAAAGELVVVNWGGPAVDAYQAAFGAPFTATTGTKVVIDGTGPLLSKIRAMVESGAVTWDVCDTGAATTLVLEKAGVIQAIDYSVVDKSKVVLDYAYDYGVANYLFSYILAYNEKTLGKAPGSWADFWDTSAFPGMRTLRKQPNGMIEAAMFAAGKTAEEIYPIDLDLAMEKL